MPCGGNLNEGVVIAREKERRDGSMVPRHILDHLQQRGRTVALQVEEHHASIESLRPRVREAPLRAARCCCTTRYGVGSALELSAHPSVIAIGAAARACVLLLRAAGVESCRANEVAAQAISKPSLIIFVARGCLPRQ